ncbi:hypothetical protein [Methanoregula sp.]|uniref:TolB family protein n=1 Tax=Methanoregula sp. TaxID=2052170 RepID=UPI00237371B6|nr:hypothetical protein [Methanoregula sp.]MDD1686936.1 hypothetical protein [Methanoregula sp.]
MKPLLQMCGIFLFILLVTTPVAALLSGTDIPFYSPHITEDESGNPYLTYSEPFNLDRDRIVWQTARLTPSPTKYISSTIWMMNMSDGETRILATTHSPDHSYRVDTPFGLAGEHVVWSENSTIFLYNQATGETSALTPDEISVEDPSLMRDNQYPVISGDHVAWIRVQIYPITMYEIALFNLTSQARRVIHTGPGKISTLSMDGSRIVWSDDRNEPGSGDIYLFDLDLNEEIPLSTARHSQYCPEISGDYVVWRDFRDGNPATYLYNLTSGTEYRISRDFFNAYAQQISGDLIAWKENSIFDTRDEPSGSIIVYSISSGAREVLPISTEFPRLFDIDGNRILWASYGEDPKDKLKKDGYIHLFVINTPNLDPVPELTPQSDGFRNHTLTPEKTASPTPTHSSPGPAVPLAVGSLLLFTGMWCQYRRG